MRIVKLVLIIIGNREPRYRQMTEGDWNRMTGRTPTESMSLKNSKNYQKGCKHLKNCWELVQV